MLDARAKEHTESGQRGNMGGTKILGNPPQEATNVMHLGSNNPVKKNLSGLGLTFPEMKFKLTLTKLRSV